jgi:siroheme synthase
VRLKAGDPFVLGRGGEEALALGEAGIEVEVVPGLSSSIVGPQAAGIPVTHRGVASAFVVVSAVPEARFVSLVSALPPESATVVVLMGMAARELVCATLVGGGWSPSTPAAVVLGAHGPRQWSRSTTLDALASLPIPHDRADLPGMLVIGEVVSVGEAIVAATRGANESHEVTRFDRPRHVGATGGTTCLWMTRPWARPASTSPTRPTSISS